MNETMFAFSLKELWQITGGQIILLAAGLLLIFLEVFWAKHDRETRTSRIGWITMIALFAALGHVMFREWNLHEVVIFDVFSMEKFTAFLVATVLMAGILATAISMGYLKNNGAGRGEYYILLVFAIYGTVAMLQSVDLLMMFITLEIMSLGVYVLAAYLKDDRASQEAAFKYFLLGSFGSAFFLFGVALIYGLTGVVNISKIAVLFSRGLFERPDTLIPLALIMCGLFFKMAMVPFHMWTPDVYEGSPSVVTGFMATTVKAGAFGIFLKIISVAFGPVLYESGQPIFAGAHRLAVLAVYWGPVLWWVSLLTMFIGNLAAVAQTNVKRMLAYSSIAHAGYMALGILAANEEGRMGVLFYLFSYTLMNLGAFGVLYLIDGRERNAQTLEDYRGLGYRNPGLSFLMALFLVAMAGLPPTAGFIGKFYVFSAAIKEGYLLLAALGVLTSVIGAYYYLRVIYMLYMKDAVRDVEPGPIGLPTAVALIAAAIGVLYLGIMPEGLTRIADAAQQSLSLVF